MIVVADVGATSMRIASAEQDGALTDVVVEDTPTSYDEGIACFAAYKSKLSSIPEAVSAGIAGQVSPDGASLQTASHMHDWANKPLTQDLGSLFHAPVYLDNDTTMGALGEALAGAGKDVPNIAYVAIGTGIGGKHVVQGIVEDPGVEIGHRMMVVDNIKKEFEEFVSGLAVLRDYGMTATNLHDPKAWDTYARYAAYGIREVLTDWHPELVILGGSLPHDDRLSLANIQKHLKEIAPELLPARFAYAALPYPGLTGAAICASRRMQGL